MTSLLSWARANPTTARIALRFTVRLVIAVAIVIPAGMLCNAYDLSPNIAAIGAVVVALGLGGRAAARLADRWQVPPEQ